MERSGIVLHVRRTSLDPLIERPWDDPSHKCTIPFREGYRSKRGSDTDRKLHLWISGAPGTDLRDRMVFLNPDRRPTIRVGLTAPLEVLSQVFLLCR